MTALRPLAERLRRGDMLQVLALFLASLVFVLATRWPGSATGANETWFELAQVRLTLLALVALAFGTAASPAPRGERAVTLAGVATFALVTVPFDVVTYAASFPNVPLAWSLALPFAEVIAYFGIGLALGRATTLLRARALLPVLVPAVLGAAIYLDVRLRLNLLNPLVAAVHVSAAHAVTVGGLAAVTLLALVLARPRPAAPTREPA